MSKTKKETVVALNVLECTLRRDGGTTVTFGTKHEVKYHFKPNASGHHVCAVPDPEHRKTLLAIDGYRMYDPNEQPLEETVLAGRYQGMNREQVAKMIFQRTRQEPPLDAPLSELVRQLNTTDTVYER